MATEQQIQDRELRTQMRHDVAKLGMRVLALHGTHYNGCGYGYELEKDLGCLLSRLNDFGLTFEAETLPLLEVIYEGLLESVEKAEASLTETSR